jgi:DNA-binding NtrC family response regulator
MKILLLESDEPMIEEFGSYFRRFGIDYFLLENETGVYNATLNEEYDLLIANIDFPHFNILKLLKYIQTRELNIKSLIISSHTDLEKNMKAINYGAFDFLRRPFDFLEAKVRLNNAMEMKKMKKQLAEEIARKLDENENLSIIQNKADKFLLN